MLAAQAIIPHIYRTFPSPKKIGFSTVSHTFSRILTGFPTWPRGLGDLRSNADDAAGVGPCVVQLHLSLRWRLDRACARFRWIRESVLLVQKKGGERWKHLETTRWTDRGVNCYISKKVENGEKTWKQFIQKNSDKKIVHFWLFFFSRGSCLYKFSWTGLKRKVILPYSSMIVMAFEVAKFWNATDGLHCNTYQMFSKTLGGLLDFKRVLAS